MNEFIKIGLKQTQLKSLMGQGGTFGVMSAYNSGRPKKENQIRHGELMRDLQKLGLRPTPLKGSWEGITEKSFMIPNIQPEVLFALGKKYGQDAVIHKSRDGVLGMYYTKGAPRAEVAVDTKGDPAFESSSEEDLFSKSRGLSFQFGFLFGKELPWDGRNPITRKTLRQFVQTQKQDQMRLAFKVASRWMRNRGLGDQV